MRVVIMIVTVIIIVTALVAATPVFAADAVSRGGGEDLSRRAKAALRLSVRRLDLQVEFPGEFPDEPPGRGKFPSESPGGPSGRERRADGPWPPRFFTSPEAARHILYGAVFVIVAAVLLRLREGLRNSGRSRPRADPEEHAPAAVAERMETAQTGADDLARRGKFAEAMHALLLQSLSELRRHL
ncbi:MAG: hypothetical protein LBQ90_10840, partial [Synergistaceae bacterium]|nr:hypothetical protein [Synergistaceae bacterium]